MLSPEIIETLNNILVSKWLKFKRQKGEYPQMAEIIFHLGLVCEFPHVSSSIAVLQVVPHRLELKIVIDMEKDRFFDLICFENAPTTKH